MIGNRLRLLLREVSTDLEGLERRLETMDTQVRGKYTEDLQPYHIHLQCGLFSATIMTITLQVTS